MNATVIGHSVNQVLGVRFIPSWADWLLVECRTDRERVCVVHVACISGTLMHFAELSYQEVPSLTPLSLIRWLAECVIAAFVAMYIVPSAIANSFLKPNDMPTICSLLGADSKTMMMPCCSTCS